MIPTAVRQPSLRYVNNTFYLSDALNNILLYMPLGIALGAFSLWRAFLCGLGLSTLAETLQLGYIDRSPSLVDITNNTIGAVLGYLAARIFLSTRGKGPRLIPLPRLLAVAAAPVALLGTFALLHNRPASDFSNWNPQYQLAVGNELNGHRPWTGTISGLAIYPFAMSAREIEVLARQGKVYPAAPGQSPIAGPFTAADLSTRFGQPLLSPDQQRKFYDALTSSNQLTILVEMQTPNLEQSGPARIVTNSGDAWGRNFTLGQNGSGLTFRLRTPATGGNGVDPALYTGPVLEANRTMQVAAVYNGRFSSVYVDGKLEAQTDLGAKRPRLPRHILMVFPDSLPLREIELVAAEILLSGLFAIGVFGMVGVPSRRSARYFLGAAAGAVIAAIICAFAVSQPGLVLRIVLECVAAGLVISASVVPEIVNPDTIS
jgi:VanZ like family/Concanavalin A-like lectin/glucanases superfamily